MIQRLDTTEESTQVRLGPITLFYEPEPPVPSIMEQARVVADFMMGIHARLGDSGAPPSAFEQLRAGDLHSFYTQRNEEEVEEMKRRNVDYDELLLKPYKLPVEQQLLDTFLNARAQEWKED